MQRSFRFAPAALAFALAGCVGAGPTGAEHNRSLDSVHQPVVRVDNYVYDADASDGLLQPTEMQRVSDWLDAIGLEYGDRVSIDEANGSAPRAAIDAIAMMVNRRGMILQQHAPITSGTIADGRMRIVITRSSAHVDGCPNWATRHVRSSNTTTSNYGCASNSNLAAMVADATDLVRGQVTHENDPLTASKAISTYRDAPTTGAGGLRGGDTRGGGGAAGGGSSGGGQ